jgi:hypothetical protein
MANKTHSANHTPDVFRFVKEAFPPELFIFSLERLIDIFSNVGIENLAEVIGDFRGVHGGFTVIYEV